MIQQCGGDRRAAAQRYERAISSARDGNPPWVIRDVSWDRSFLDELVAGDSTGVEMVEHFAQKTMGAGDLAILVERDQFRKATAFSDVRIWSLDAKLTAYAGD
jgi:hypothetical protein